MNNTELNDLNRIIEANNFCKDDFEIEEDRCDEHTSTHTFLPRSRLTITYLPTKVSRTYDSGHLSTWLPDFETDLKSRAFDS